MIRNATIRDGGRLAELWTRFLEEQASVDSRISPSTDAVQRFQADLPVWISDSTYLVALAEEKNDIVGFVTGYLWSMPPVFEEVPEVFVEYLFVDSSFRRQGIGRALLGYAQDWGREHDVRRLRAGVLCANERAISFWHAAGGTDFVREIIVELPSTGAQPHRKPLGFIGNP